MTARFADAATRLAGQAMLLTGWRPHAFWNATPAELESILRALAPEGEAAPMGRSELAALMQQFPDGEAQHG